MRSQFTAITIAALALAAGAASSSTAVASATPDCLRGGTTIAANTHARLFRVGLASEHALFVCWRPTRRVRELGYLTIDQIGPVAEVLSGDWVSYDRQRCFDRGAGCEGRVVVRNARTGRQLRVAPDQRGIVHGLVLDGHGTAAWIRETGTTTAICMVYTLDARGVTVLDPGPNVEPDSLARAGSRAYWLRDGTPISALLNARASPGTTTPRPTNAATLIAPGDP